MKQDDLADTPDYMQSLALIAKHLNYLKICIINLAKKHCTSLHLAFPCLDTWTTNFPSRE